MSAFDDDDDAYRDERPRPLMSPSNMLPVQVVRRTVIAPEVVSLEIALPGTNQPPAPYLPGQFVTLAFPTKTETLYRSYSLCSDGMPTHPWEITIKRMAEGAVSTYLYDFVEEGTLLYSSLPRGAFTLPANLTPQTPLIFIAVGSGITPIFGMLQALDLMPDDERPPVQLHYASRTREDIIFRRDLARLDPEETWLQQWHYLSSEGHRMTASDIVQRVGRLGRRAHWYMCGPESLKRDVQRIILARGAAEERIHTEVFATERGASTVNFKMMTNEGDGNVSAYMRVEATDAVLGVQANETVLAALERHGYHPDSSCRAGSCGVCKLQLLSGNVDQRSGTALTPGERAAGYILSCIARPQGDITIAAGGQPPTHGELVAAGVAPRLSRSMTTMALRVSTVLTAGGLLLGAWQLTNHRPFSWQAHAQAPAPTATNVPGGTSTQTTSPHATPTIVGGPTATPTVFGAPTATPTVVGAPTATPKPGGNPSPTATPIAHPTATPPPPTATATPSTHP
jgi:ferredoxin-NADP reductase